ncbi:MAG TPA: hypothetical protein VIC57_04625 [Candidatus Dormibacteraeota bacterium]|jgi:sarcosine oxidase gamma subunit
MSTTPRSSALLRIGVPIYLLVIGLGLLAGMVALIVYSPDEWFVAGMAGVGGVTMLATMALLLTAAKNR